MRRVYWEDFEEVLDKISNIDVNNYTNEKGEKPDRVKIRLFMNSLKDMWWREDFYDDPATFPEWFIGCMKYNGCLGENGEVLEKFNRISRAEFCVYFYKGDEFIGLLPFPQIEPRIIEE